MTVKTVVIKFGDAEILIDRRDLKNIDLSLLRINVDGYAVIGDKLLHRIIMNPPADKQIDHKNKNTLDNRRSNLRETKTLKRNSYQITGNNPRRMAGNKINNCIH